MNKTDISADRLGKDGDAFYEALMKAHEGLSAGQSAKLNARLVLLLANQVGDLRALRATLARAALGLVDETPKPNAAPERRE